MQAPLKLHETGNGKGKRKQIPTNIPEERGMKCETLQSLESSPSSSAELLSPTFNYIKVQRHKNDKNI